jgi:hypothetical protein
MDTSKKTYKKALIQNKSAYYLSNTMIIIWRYNKIGSVSQFRIYII